MSESGFQDAPAEEFGQIPANPASAPNPEDAVAAREHGWGEDEKLDYDAFNAPTSDSNPAWASSAQVYEWSGEEGDVGAPDLELEEQLFRNGQSKAGTSLDHILNFSATLEGPKQFAPIGSFDTAGLHPQVLANVQLCNYDRITVIQGYCIPIILAGHDLVAVAQTGSGKTAAYLIPIISKLMGKVRKLQGPRPAMKGARVRAEPLVVIVVPTRELAQQIFDEARRLCYRSMLRPVCAYGGIPMSSNLQELAKGCDLLIGTPGRLQDLMDKPDILSMKRVKFTVIDEADEMLQGDWEDEMNKIMGGGDMNEDPDHAYLMFSATFPKESRAIARTYMDADFMRVRIGRAGSTHKNVTQDVVFIERHSKKQALYDLLMARPPCRTLVFCNSKPGVEEVDDYLYNRQLPTVFMHGGRSQLEREDAMRRFKGDKPHILIATNVFGRGIDVPQVNHVINYDLPGMEYGGISEYIHRIGRTGRIGHKGHATSFYNERNEDIAPALVNILLETEQEVPDFLQDFKPENGQAEFEDDVTDNEDEASEPGYVTAAGEAEAPAEAATGGGWGTDASTPAVAADAGWGAATEPVTASW
ncbi:DEAD/DEAH box RNA helicase [Aureobasidium pullulans]|uniref:RNA helicase n=1 Tax=Aureobasidium pullulans TaxID=5580 RepID=A0A4V4I1K0_AURPU|nr:DEAD/DEAH box RNA helicase [Aureobasidium pullulans]